MKTINRHIAFCIITIALNVMFTPGLYAQAKAAIQNVDFFVEANKIIITYDIVESQPEESFNIWMQVKSTSGKILNAKSTSGDIGKGIKGGPEKRIEWDYALDQFNLEEEISIEVFADAEKTAKKSESRPVTSPQIKDPNVRNISVGKALLFSALLPGLGKTYVKGHGASWLLGVTGYGLIAVSVLTNHSAYNKLEEYRLSTDADEQDKLYKGAKLNAAMSYVSVVGAVVIWVVDIITTGVKAGKARKTLQNRVQLNGSFDQQAGLPLIGLTYKF